MKPFSFIRDAVRAKQIITVLVRHGFTDLLERLSLPTGWLNRLIHRSDERLSGAQRLRRICEELGPTFVKIAQFLSTRPDLLPEAFLSEFKQLRDQVKAEPFSSIELLLESELGDLFDEHFSAVCEEPIGSGSVAQVHKARLKDGRFVALKVQRPNIEKLLVSDLEILAWLADEIHARIGEMRRYNFPSLVQLLREGLLKELDFTREARNNQIFNKNNPYKEYIFAPDIHREFCTKRLLVSDYVDGKTIQSYNSLDEDAEHLASMGARSEFHQIMISGFFHADPHPGNILVTKDKRLCLLDWGMIGRLTRRMRYHLSDLLYAITMQDPERIARVAIAMSDTNRLPNEQRLEMQIASALGRCGGEVLLEDIGSLILDLLRAFADNGLRMPSDYALLARAVLSIEQSGKSLYPEFELEKEAKPFFEQLAMERLKPKNVLRSVWLELRGSIGRLSQLPSDLQRLLRRVENEDLTINLRHEGLADILSTFYGAVNRVVVALIVGALIIGSSLIVTTGAGPTFSDIPVLGIAGYSISFFMGIWIVFSILRSGGFK